MISGGMYSVVEYRAELAPEVIALWNVALGVSFPMTERLWRQNVDTDPNYAAGDGFVAYATDGALAGIVLTRMLRGREDNPDLASIYDLGWILALVVAPRLQRQGVGTQLLALAEERLRQRGARRCRLGGGLGHFLPGPPVGEARAFWLHNGYEPLREEYDLRRSLTDYVAPPLPTLIRDGTYRIAVGAPGEEAAVLAFLNRCFPGRWRYEVAQTLARGGSIADVLLLKDRAEAIQGFLSSWSVASATLGPSTYWYPLLGPRFGGIGPLGIASEVRKHGLGLALVAAGAEMLRKRGVTECVIDWTTLADFYGRLGYTVWRRYWSCQPKRLAPE